jgi:nucleoside-diphosphate-sugar epimerase
VTVLVTGADGYIGRALVARLLQTRNDRLVLLDRQFAHIHPDPRVRMLTGDCSESGTLRLATQERIDQVFHLASVPGGLAEREFELGLRVNLEGTIELLEALRRQGSVPRFVFASTIGVFGVPMPALVDESTVPEPTLSYGAQKWMGEILMKDYSRRGFIDGCALRLPGIVSRPPEPSGLLSAFLSDLFRELGAGRTFTCPVGADGKTWLMSRICVVENLLRGAALEAEQLQAQRVWLLPVLHASIAEIVDVIARVHGNHVLNNIRYEPNAALQAQFASLPPLACPRSMAAGFKNDGSLEVLVQRALE